MRRLIYALLLICSSSFAAQPQNQNIVERKEVQQFIQQMVKEHHFDRNELTAVMANVKLQPKIIESIQRPYEKKSWDVYKQLFLTHNRVEAGMQFWNENRALLSRAEKEYGIPANIIVAIIGVETLYGKNQGNYRVIDALSTLAFDYPKRSAFFTKELKEYLLLCKEHGINPGTYKGSYAGAMGMPQFMPSSYRAYAADFKKSKKKDLMNDKQAVIASVANYFKQHGWQSNQGIAQLAKVQGNAYKALKTNTRKPEYRWEQLQKAGVKPVTAAINTPKKAGLIALETAEGSEYWLAYPNFYVITRYNQSPQYALAVYLLAQQLQNQWTNAYSKHDYALA
ncbi:MAG: lytic murein transglycosylase B [Legionellaceae bacterium]|nr:lytic murein transglycosylase B [Legionellaceae bacterium]